MITIVGCGALGSLFAGALLDTGLPVQGFLRPGAHLEACRRQGLRVVRPDGEARIYHFPLEDRPENLAPGHLLLVLVKAYQTADVAPLLPLLLAPGGTVLTLQNGLGNAEILVHHVPAEHLALGSCTYGAFRSAPGEVRWGGAGEIRLGPWDPSAEVDSLVQVFRRAGLEAHATTTPQQTVWEKAIVNAAINPVTALARCVNGQVLQNLALQNTCRALCEEATEVARREGYPIEKEILWHRVLAVLEATSKNRSSMLQDVEHNRRTEVDAICGAVLDQGTRLGVSLPVISCVTALLRVLDAQAAER